MRKELNEFAELAWADWLTLTIPPPTNFSLAASGKSIARWVTGIVPRNARTS
ncbi:hypothetical protein M407DRAFT_244692 [Tulasnella calospora MUT 4182]|uniref:Uncharacterized protein n=1 Tax=Tulasnella calospora MUT 4182 TaxID=1051891 RepID=A0A0C3QEY6_9AGAM|nr:hypothetical protein M407DRAFT_244692 [Tulasnella calospora MUT 4182]